MPATGLVHALRTEIFTSPLETAATLLGIANITLLIRRSIWNYPAGLLMVSLYAYVFFHARLYSDTLLQAFFFVVQIAGWVSWLRHREPSGEIIVETSTWRELAVLLAATFAAALLLGYAMGRWAHAAFPYWDATVASASVIAQLLLTWRRLENWLWWIGANILSILVYARKSLYLTSGLYTFFLVMAILGYLSWRANLNAQRATPSEPRPASPPQPTKIEPA